MELTDKTEMKLVIGWLEDHYYYPRDLRCNDNRHKDHVYIRTVLRNSPSVG